MTPQEQQLLMQLTQRINQTHLQEKDEDAQNLLGRELGANPDALYIMAQTLLVQNMGLQQLKAQVAQLQQQLQTARQQPAHTTSFLGRLFGEHDQQPQQPPPRPQQAYQPPPGPQPQEGWQPIPQYPQAAPPQYAQTQYAPQYVVAAGQPSFFRGAMQTAAGVAAGALAFEGVESLLHGFGHGGGWGPGMGGFGMGPGMGFGGGFERPVEETVINNYYDQPGPMGSGDHRVEHDFGGHPSGGGQDWQGGERHFQNTGDGSGAVYSDADYTGPNAGSMGTDGTAGDSQGSLDQGSLDQGSLDQGAFDQDLGNDSLALDTSLDDMQIDDSGSGLDDGGGFDSGGFDNSGGDGF